MIVQSALRRLCEDSSRNRLGLSKSTIAGKDLELRQSVYHRESWREIIVATLDMIAGRSGGRVSIGAGSMAKYFVPFAIAAFSKLHPKIDITLKVGNQEDIREALRGYDLMGGWAIAQTLSI